MSVCHLRYIASPLRRTVWALICLVFLFSAPTPLFAETPPQLLSVSSALTSFYGNKFEGKKTASGQRYNSEALTAAHRSLPFGTVVRVTNLSNGRDAIVRVNDRGPWSKRLMLDISLAAAREINMIRAGVTKIQMEQVGDTRGRPVISGTEFFLDLGTATTETRGKSQIEQLRKKLISPAASGIKLVTEAIPGNKKRLFVGIGPFSTFQKAENAFMELKKTWPRARVVCAKTKQIPASGKLVSQVPADDVPTILAGYKGKASLPKAGISKKNSSSKKKGVASQKSGKKKTSSKKKTSRTAGKKTSSK